MISLEAQVTDTHKYPLAAVTQRPMAMYHSWDSQNAWLRQIHTHNYLYVNARRTALHQGIEDGDWIWVESQWGRVQAAWRDTPRRSSPARYGPGMQSARQRGRGT
jgi:anaerobic selenocysteine-containing dehydrogenase